MVVMKPDTVGDIVGLLITVVGFLIEHFSKH